MSNSRVDNRRLESAACLPRSPGPGPVFARFAFRFIEQIIEAALRSDLSRIVELNEIFFYDRESPREIAMATNALQYRAPFPAC